MKKYQIIAKSEVPEGLRRRWVCLFDPLSFTEAVKFDCESKKEATDLRSLLQSTLARNRRAKYSIHTRIIPLGTVFELYVWKEEVSHGL